MKEKVICGIQQVGIGVSDVVEATAWYNQHLGFDIRILDDDGVAERMLPYTGGQPQARRAMLMVNLRGGGGLEIWQPKGRDLRYLSEPAQLGDLGIFSAKIKSPDAWAAYQLFKAEDLTLLTEPMPNPAGKLHFFMHDLYGNLLDVEEDDYVLVNEKKVTGGANGAMLGVSDMEQSMDFYGKLMGYDKVVYDQTGVFDDLRSLPSGHRKVRRVRLASSQALQGPLSPIMGTAYIELVQALEITPKKLYEGRWWGDPGFIHLCFDVRNMSAVQTDAEALGHPFVCDSGADFGMGDANGHFTYVEDPDGTLIEFVETFKITLLKKWGLALNLTWFDDRKPLPKWMLRAMRFLRVKA